MLIAVAVALCASCGSFFLGSSVFCFCFCPNGDSVPRSLLLSLSICWVIFFKKKGRCSYQLLFLLPVPGEVHRHDGEHHHQQEQCPLDKGRRLVFGGRDEVRIGLVFVHLLEQKSQSINILLEPIWGIES